MISKLRLRAPDETATGIALSLEWERLASFATTVPRVLETLLIVATLDRTVVEWLKTPPGERCFPRPDSTSWSVRVRLSDADLRLGAFKHRERLTAEVEGRLLRLENVGLVARIDVGFWCGFRDASEWTLGKVALAFMAPARLPGRAGPTPKRTPRKTIPQGTRFDVLERSGFRCFYCARRGAEAGELEIDHVIPVAKGGSSDVSNLVAACHDCNQGKRAKVIDLVGELQ